MTEELSEIDKFFYSVRLKLKEWGFPVIVHPISPEQKEAMRKVVERNKLKIEELARSCGLFNKRASGLICEDSECPILTICWTLQEHDKEVLKGLPEIFNDKVDHPTGS